MKNEEKAKVKKFGLITNETKKNEKYILLK